MDRWLSRRLAEHGIIKGEEQEIYCFGIRNGIILLLNFMTALFIGIFTGKLTVVIVFTTAFMLLRGYTGGYHADSRFVCYIGSTLVVLFPVFAEKMLCRIVLQQRYTLLFLAFGIILLFSPMDSKKRKLDETERRHFGLRAWFVAFMEMLAYDILWQTEQIPYAYAVYMAVCITAILMLAGKIQLWRQFHTE